MLNRSLPRIDTSHFSMIPRADIPRSTFITTHSYKTTFDCGYLIPIFVDEVLPGDSHYGDLTIFARLATPLFPIMDHMQLETFFFFVPNRLVWANWKRMMGERASPGDSISFTVPQVVSAAGGFPIKTIYDYMGLPTVGQVGGGNSVSVNVLPLRAYQLIYDQWFRDENLDATYAPSTGDGPDAVGNFAIQRRRKKHDYFTSCLPWPLKGGVDVPIPMGGQAPLRGLAIDDARTPTTGNPTATEGGGVASTGWAGFYQASIASTLYIRSTGTGLNSDPIMYADLAAAVGSSINSVRLAFQTQKLLERDARGGTRYTELLRAHFGVTPEDQRLQRPEYIGGGTTPIQTSAIPQTSATGLTGGSTPLGGLGAAATATGQHRFSYHATEHGFILGIAHVTSEITYQQGLHRMWTRSTRYDFYWPAFAHLGEQAVRNDEIYCDGSANDTATFGYQERWAEYRHRPSRLTGLFRSTSAGTIDPWHLAQKFTTLPALNSTFIADTPPVSRALAAGAGADGMQVLFDSVFRIKSTRPLPMYSVPGQIDRF